MVKQNPGCEVVQDVRIENVSFVIVDGKCIELLSNPALGKYRVGNKVKKWELSMLPIFCAYCGKRIQEDK
jgi:hypothetical protein